MAELYEYWLVSKMTRAELNELSDDERKERKRLQQKISDKKYYQKNMEKYKEYREEHKEEKAEYNIKHYQENPEYYRQYRETPSCKKSMTISSWVNNLGLQESPEDLDRIYELRETQELCNACDCVLTRTGKLISTDATMDHDHDTHRFRHIICRTCNTMDNWKQYFC